MISNMEKTFVRQQLFLYKTLLNVFEKARRKGESFLQYFVKVVWLNKVKIVIFLDENDFKYGKDICTPENGIRYFKPDVDLKYKQGSDWNGRGFVA